MNVFSRFFPNLAQSMIFDNCFHFLKFILTPETPKFCDDFFVCIIRLGVNVLFTVGGDGTQQGAQALVDEIARQGRDIAIVGAPHLIPYTIFCNCAWNIIESRGAFIPQASWLRLNPSHPQSSALFVILSQRREWVFNPAFLIVFPNTLV